MIVQVLIYGLPLLLAFLLIYKGFNTSVLSAALWSIISVGVVVLLATAMIYLTAHV